MVKMIKGYTVYKNCDTFGCNGIPEYEIENAYPTGYTYPHSINPIQDVYIFLTLCKKCWLSLVKQAEDWDKIK